MTDFCFFVTAYKCFILLSTLCLIFIDLFFQLYSATNFIGGRLFTTRCLFTCAFLFSNTVLATLVWFGFPTIACLSTNMSACELFIETAHFILLLYVSTVCNVYCCWLYCSAWRRTSRGYGLCRDSLITFLAQHVLLIALLLKMCCYLFVAVFVLIVICA